MGQTVGYLLKEITDKIKVSADASFKLRNLSFSQARLLECLSDREGRATQKSIEEFLKVSHPTVVGLISRMEKKGYLRCYQDENDKRNKIVEMTENARLIAHEMQDEVAAQEAKLLKGLTKEEIESLKRMLQMMYRNIQ